MTEKELFIKTVRDNIKRDGVEEFLAYLETTDFYTAPASTIHHSCFEGGLVHHSLMVFDELLKSPNIKEYSRDSIAFVSLFHDVCKVNTYKVEMRNTKNEYGSWIKVPYFKTDEEYPFGHGEKSVYLLMKHGFGNDITDEEALAIDWHMGSYDTRTKGGSFGSGNAFSMSALALELHIADMRATHLRESKDKK